MGLVGDPDTAVSNARANATVLVRTAHVHLRKQQNIDSSQRRHSPTSKSPLLTLPVPSATASSSRWVPQGSVTLSPNVIATTLATSTVASSSISDEPPAITTRQCSGRRCGRLTPHRQRTDDHLSQQVWDVGHTRQPPPCPPLPCAAQPTSAHTTKDILW